MRIAAKMPAHSYTSQLPFLTNLPTLIPSVITQANSRIISVGSERASRKRLKTVFFFRAVISFFPKSRLFFSTCSRLSPVLSLVL